MESTKHPTGNHGLAELLGKAVVDPTFRDKLFASPDAVADEYGLAPNDKAALKTIDRAKIDEAATQMTSRSQIAISIVIRIKF
jgi:hypothetical protein